MTVNDTTPPVVTVPNTTAEAMAVALIPQSTSAMVTAAGHCASVE